MKRKLTLIVFGLLVFLSYFITSLFVRDYFYEQALRENINRIKIGMPEGKVITILGKPSNIAMSDISGTYWSYNTNSFYMYDNPEYIGGYLLLEMSSDKKVVKVIGFKD